MTLYGLAITSYLFSKIFDFDESLAMFQKKVGRCVDLAQTEHRDALLVWLNQWGCRQFALKDHATASAEIATWYDTWRGALPETTVDLWLASDRHLEVVSDAYGDLSQRPASTRGGTRVRIGPVGASKILFAMRPRLLPPWDTPIRKRFGYDESPASYKQYLFGVRATLLDLAAECSRHGFTLTELPARLGLPEDTVPKLVDKYYWITITREACLPEPARLSQWLQWS